MKQTLITLGLFFCLAATAQKKDSLLVTIQLDSTTFKQVVQLIQENINGNTLTGKMVLQNVLQPLYQGIRLLPQIEADKPKEIIKPIKK